MMKTYPKEELVGQKVWLKRFPGMYESGLLQAINCDRERLEKHIQWARSLRSREDEEEQIRRFLLEWEEMRSFTYRIFYGSVFVGCAIAHTLAWADEKCELGYWLIGEAEGKGLATEAVDILAKEMFRLGFYRLEIRCDPRNERSAALPSRLGFALEGILRADSIENGERHDSMVWAKLAANS